MKLLLITIVLLTTLLLAYCRDILPSSRIVGGSNARPEIAPWQTFVKFPHEVTSDEKWIWTHYKDCGGSFLRKDWVLTAAHCCEPLLPGHDAIVKYGGTNTQNMSSTTSTKVIKHPHYDKKTADHDFCLVKLVKPVELSDTVMVIPMASSYPSNETIAIAMGWGRTDGNNEKSTSPVLLEAELNILDRDTCVEKYKFGGDRPIHNDQICTNTMGKSICQGDSGGPLTVMNGTIRELVGVVSFVQTGCPKIGLPNVYGFVPKVKSWILATMNEQPDAHKVRDNKLSDDTLPEDKVPGDNVPVHNNLNNNFLNDFKSEFPPFSFPGFSN